MSEIVHPCIACGGFLLHGDRVVDYVKILKEPRLGDPNGMIEGHHDFVHAGCDPGRIPGWRRVAVGTLDERLRALGR